MHARSLHGGRASFRIGGLLMEHRYHYVLGQDADYIVWESLEPAIAGDGWHWVEHTRWLIPGTQLED